MEIPLQSMEAGGRSYMDHKTSLKLNDSPFVFMANIQYIPADTLNKQSVICHTFLCNRL
jgi:hypothetical protein